MSDEVTKAARVQLLTTLFTINAEQAGQADDVAMKLAGQVLADLNENTNAIQLGNEPLNAVAVWHTLKSLEALAGLAAASILGDDMGECQCVGCTIKRKMAEQTQSGRVH